MKIGITGTRSGCNELQFREVKNFLSNFPKGTEFHHGDCVGVDVEVAQIAKDLGFYIVCHPPEKDDLRGFFPYDETRKPLSYFARNRNIVDETDILMVVPVQNEWQPNGGTWYTYDYADKKKKSIGMFWPVQKF